MSKVVPDKMMASDTIIIYEYEVLEDTKRRLYIN